MDAIKELLLEIGGISKDVIEFSMSSDIANAFSEMKKALENHDFEAVDYCVQKVFKWYECEAIPQIEEEKKKQYYDNGYDLEMHAAVGKLQRLYEKIEDECALEGMHINECSVASCNRVFISHKSDDKKYGDALRNYLIGLGLRDEQLIYTSHPLNKIPLGENIYEYLRKNIHAGIFMIILWSDKYLESPACLNEMGAAWVVQVDYTNVYVPTFSFGNPKYHECAVDTRKMGAILNGDQHCKASMIELKNKIQETFGLQDEEKCSSYLLDRFIEEIQ